MLASNTRTLAASRTTGPRLMELCSHPSGESQSSDTRERRVIAPSREYQLRRRRTRPAPAIANRPKRASAGQGTPGVLAGWPVAGRTMAVGVGVGVVTTAALALLIVAVTAALPIVIVVSAAAAAPVGRVDSCRTMLDVVGSVGSCLLSPLHWSDRERLAGSANVVASWVL